MSNYFAVDLCGPSFDELFPLTPSGSSAYASESVFTPNTLRDGIRFTPSAWKTPHRQTVESPIRDVSLCDAYQASTPNTGTSSSSSLDMPAHQRVIDPLGRSQTPHRTPGAPQTAIDNIGVTPARIMGEPSHMFSHTPLPPSPSSLAAGRKIYTPKRLLGNVKSFQDRESLDASLFGVASTSTGPATSPFGGLPPFHPAPGTSSWFPQPPPSARTIYSVLCPSLSAAPMGMAPVRTLPPLLEAATIGGNVGVLDGTKGAGRIDGENGRVGGDHEGRNGSESETEGVVHHTNTLTEQIHSQQMAQNGGAASDGNVWLPFPDDRDMLVTYLEEGLSLRYLFPSSKQGNRVRCEADLKLVGGHWRRTEVCDRIEGSLDSYQRHVKSVHLSATRGSDTRVAMDHIVNILWNYRDKTIPRPRPWLRVQPWDEQVQDFPRLVAPPNTDQG